MLTKDTIDELKEKLKEAQNKIAELEKAMDLSYERPLPDEERGYWFICDTVRKVENARGVDLAANVRYELGLSFPKKHQAENFRLWLKIRAELIDVALRLNKGRTADNLATESDKAYLYLTDNEIEQAAVYDNTNYYGDICCFDKSFKEVALKEVGEEALKFFFTYDHLDVT